MRAVVRGKRAHLFSDNAKLKPWREVMTEAAKAAVGDGWEPLDGPLVLSALFTMPRPQRPRWWLPAVKPDLDKLLRALGDSLTDSKVIADDARIVGYRDVFEVYAEDGTEPGVRVWLEVLTCPGAASP